MLDRVASTPGQWAEVVEAVECGDMRGKGHAASVRPIGGKYAFIASEARRASVDQARRTVIDPRAEIIRAKTRPGY